MLARLVIAFIVCLVFYLKVPLTLCLSSNPTCMIGELEIYCFLFGLYFFFELVCILRVKILKFQSRKKIEAFTTNLQSSIESMIMKDYKAVNKFLDKAENIAGIDSPLLNWMRGFERLYSKNNHEAKAKFFEIAYKKNSILGGYSLYKLAEQEGNKRDAYDALKQIKANVEHVPDAILLNLIKYQLQNNDFTEARKNINKIKNNRLLGISYFLEDPSKMENLKLAFNYTKNIPEIAIAYAKKLMFLKCEKMAKNVIMKCWASSPHPLIFHYWCGVNKKNEIEVAKKFVENVSFEGYLEFALLLFENDILPLSYKYFKEAFIIHPTKKVLFYINQLRDKLEKQQDDIMCEENIVDENITFDDPVWRCKICNGTFSAWEAFCPNCDSLDAIYWEYNTNQQKLPQVEEAGFLLLHHEK